MMDSKTFCIAPWHDTHIITDGSFKGCCVMNSGPNKGILQTNGKNLKVQNEGIRGAINSDTLKDIRQSMLNDEWHPECIRCQKEEKSGMSSMRLMYEDRWKDKFTLEDAISITDEDGSLPDEHTPFFYDLQLGNLCNLKCRICRPTVSSSWIPDYVKLYPGSPMGEDGSISIKHIKGKQYELTPNPFSWAETDEFWEQMSLIKSEITNLYLIGGEPMMIHRHFDFLKECVESGDSKHIALQYDTNLTNLPEKVMKYWSEFKEIRIGFSIDGMGDELEYMRNPVKWKHILKNIDIVDKFSYDNLPDKWDGPTVYDVVTVSIYNVLHVLDYIEWKIKAGRTSYNLLWKEHPSHFGVHPLHQPSHLCVQTMPHSAKIVINAKYSNWRTKMLKWVDELDTYTEHQSKESLKESINTYVDTWLGFINQNDNSKEMSYFWDYTNKLDEIRDESFSDVFPELNSLLLLDV